VPVARDARRAWRRRGDESEAGDGGGACISPADFVVPVVPSPTMRSTAVVPTNSTSGEVLDAGGVGRRFVARDARRP
jgi:hypothetical protein